MIKLKKLVKLIYKKLENKINIFKKKILLFKITLYINNKIIKFYILLNSKFLII